MTQPQCKTPTEYVYDGFSKVGRFVGTPLKYIFDEMTGRNIMRRGGMDVNKPNNDVGEEHKLAVLFIPLIAFTPSFMAMIVVNADIAHCASFGADSVACSGYSHFATQMEILKYATAALVATNILPALYRVGKFKKEQRLEAKELAERLDNAKNRALKVGFGQNATQQEGESMKAYVERLEKISSEDRLGRKPKAPAPTK